MSQQEQTKAHKPRIIGTTVLLICEVCGVELPQNYVCPMCRWDQSLTPDGGSVIEVCVPCFLHGGF